MSHGKHQWGCGTRILTFRTESRSYTHPCDRLSQGPQALKAELKRKRLATLKAATIASFKTTPSERDSSAGVDADQDVDTLSHAKERDSEERNRSIAKTSHPETSISASGAQMTTTGAVPESGEGTISMRGIETFDGHHSQGPPSSSRLASDDRTTLHRRVDTTDRIWRASLNNPKTYRSTNKFSSDGGVPTMHGEHDGKASHRKFSSFQDDGYSSTWVRSSSGSAGVGGIPLGAGRGSDKKTEEARTVLAQGPRPAVRLDKLPAEVLASMLLSDQNFAGDKTSADVLDRVRQWGTDEMIGHNSTHQPFPDLPYGFTNLARRLNDLNDHKHQDLAPESRSPLLSEDTS